MASWDNEATGTAEIHPRSARGENKIDWDMKPVKYRGSFNDDGRTWGKYVFEPNDIDCENPLGREVEIVNVKPDPKPVTPSRDQL